MGNGLKLHGLKLARNFGKTTINTVNTCGRALFWHIYCGKFVMFILRRRATSNSLGWQVWLVIAFWVSCAFGDTRFIRLRNATIPTPPASQSAFAQPQSLTTSVSGLYLIQFNEHFQSVWLEQLRNLNVDLLNYVPDDAFVVRLRQAQLGRIKTLPFVRWLGDYQPFLKVHPKLIPSPASTSNPESLAIRLLLARDVTPDEISTITDAMPGLHLTGHWRFGVTMEGNVRSTQLIDLAQSPSALWLEAVAHPRLLDEVSTKIVGGQNSGRGHPSAVQQLGFDGSGVTIAVADSGLNNGDAATMHLDLKGRVDAFFYYGSLTNAADQHGHGTHISGIIAGNGATGEMDENSALYGLGIAPNAHLVVQRIFDAAGNYQAPASNELLTQDAIRAGAVIGSNSWGEDNQGAYDLHAAEFDSLVRDADPSHAGDQPYILIFSAGNSGPRHQTIDSPATAKNVIAVGASENSRSNLALYQDGPDSMADFSSRGPCEDGRIKPDLVAPGTWIASLQSAAASDQYARMSISPRYQYQQGTSQAGSHISGAAAVFVQYYRQNHTNSTPSPALVKAALINSAAPLALSAANTPIPNQDEGWGRVDLTQLVGSARRFEFVDQTVLLSTGQTYEHSITVINSDESLKITMAYTDVPGLPAAIPALVNDLDLEVLAPDGSLYYGNQFDNGESVPGASTTDNLNNVEEVVLSHPLTGEYLVRVRASNIAADSRSDTTAIDQDFGLVISGGLSLPGLPGLTLDRSAYTVPATIQIKLIDLALPRQAIVPVTLWSSTQTNGLTLQLRSANVPGAFTGAVATAFGPVVPDGNLHINQGDLIEALYTNQTTTNAFSVSARAQLVPPIISGVTANNQNDNVIITWLTERPATSQVRYGTNANLSLSFTNSTLCLNHQVTLGNLAVGATNLFMVISSDAAGNTVTNDNQGRLFQVVVSAAATVLLVDDYQSDGITQDIPESAYTSAFDQAQTDYTVWNVQSVGRYPTVDDLRPYRVVIWRINDSIYSTTTIYPPQQATLQAYLVGGGSFMLASMEILSRLEPSAFLTNVLHLQSFQTDLGVPAIQGVDNDPITSGLATDLDYSAFPRVDVLNLGPDLSDVITPASDAAPILLKSMTDQFVGLRFPRTGQDGVGRVVFLSFPLEAIPMTNSGVNNRSGILRKILSFLAPDRYRSATIALDNSTYTLPARVIVEVTDNNLSNAGKIMVKFFSNSDTNGEPLAIYETVRRGQFRGFMTVVAATNAPSPGQLRAANNDQIWAEYFDVIANSPIRATAAIDAVEPVITSVVAEPEYAKATIRWNSSKSADSLVQFGESTFLGRIAYQSDLTINHVLTIDGLVPDHEYFYQVASRDAAGNTTVDDNQGQLYAFHTLATLLMPWSDSLDSGGTNWTVINNTPGGASWQLGVPQNGRETSAHSPPNAWGSNLNGAPIDSANTTLISPAIYLTGGQLATLHFWQSYAFTTSSDTVISEIGRVLVTTNDAKSWQTLASFLNASDGWEKTEIDLTPFLGQVVRLGWNYSYFALDALSRPGWLVDDISITVTNQPHGSILITNNLSQALFTLSGPLSQSGQGWSFMVNNAPVGQYTVTYKPVPFYQTPPPQTNTLSSTNIVVFQGNYTFDDTNHNGISDAWEQFYFGTVSATHYPTMDSDRDGFSDYAEFIAGTDPTNALSRLQLLPPTRLTNNMVLLEWPSAVGRAYRVEATTNGLMWTPVSDWIRAEGTRLALSQPINARNVITLFRLTVRP